MIVLTSLFEHRLSQLVEQHNRSYGSALARTAAQQAVDATLNHDLVSLQVILQDIAANSGILLATIHDVENKLLVQAGDASLVRNTKAPLDTHTAPITLHDSVAGYVTVTLSGTAEQRFARSVTVAVIALLLAVIGGLSLYEHRAAVFSRRSKPSLAVEPEHGQEDDTGVDQSNFGSETLAEASQHAIASIHASNLESLRRQLSASLFEDTIRSFEELLAHVLSLYNGHIASKDEQGLYSVRFEGTDSPTDAAFRAVCAAWLATRLAAHLKPAPLALGSRISLAHSDQNLPITAGQLLLDSEVVSLNAMPEKLEAIPRGPEAQQYALQDLKQPSRALLERQYQQLKLTVL